MRIDLKLNYGQLEAVSARIYAYYDVLDTLEQELKQLKDFLEEQESEAVIKLLEKMDNVKIKADDKKTTLEQLGKIVDSYLEDMRSLVKEVTFGQLTRVDKWDIAYNIHQIKDSVQSMDICSSGKEVSETFWKLGENAKEEQQKQERNYRKLENFRSGTLRSLVQSLNNSMSELDDLYKKYIDPFETMDDSYRKKINDIYKRRTGWIDKTKNFWEQVGKISEAFLTAFVVAFAVTIIVILAPAWAVAGTIAVAGVGCAIMANIPEEYVPEWLSGAKDFSDDMAVLCKRTLEDGPLVLLDAAGQGIMDQIQTPEGIAAFAGSLTGTYAGSYVGIKLKPDIPSVKTEMLESGSEGSRELIHSYDGVKQASEYLQEQGVPRVYRKRILESFDVETIKLQTAGESTYGLRFYGGGANAEGRYLFETFSPLTNRQNLALPYEWNSMTGIQQFQIRNGTTMITGKVAAQEEFGSQYIGGAGQWYINNLEDLIRCH